MSTKRRSNVVAKALLVTALASGIAGMQAMPAHADDENSNVDIRYVNITGDKYDPVTYESVFSSRTPQDAKQIDFTRNIQGITSIYTYNTSYTDVPGFVYFATDTTVPKSIASSTYGTYNDCTFKGGTIYLTLNGKFAVLGDAKSILGSGSSSGLSEEQKTMIKDLIANVEGNQKVSGNQEVTGNDTVGGNQTVKGDSQVNGTSTSKDNHVTNNSTVDGKLTTGSEEVKGDSTVGGSQTVKGDSTVNGKTDTGSLEVKGDATVDGSQTVKGDSTVEGSSTTNGNATVKGDLGVEGSTNLKDTTVDGSLGVTGDTTIDGSLEVKGDATVDGSQTVKGDSTVEGSSTTNGNATIKGDLGVEGSTNLKDTTITGKLDVIGNQEVTGSIYAHGDMVANNAGFNNLAVINAATIGNQTDFVNMKDGNIVATGSITALGNLGIAGNTVLNGDVQMNSNAAVKGTLDVGQDIYIGGKSVLGKFAQQDQKINKTGAAAAAMAGLHPLDFDEDQKLNFAAATGSYHGSSAIALGMFYRPNEQVMFNISGSSSGSEHMYTFGASFALDRPSATHVSSRRALTEKVQQLSEVNEAVIKQSMALQAKNDELQTELAELRKMVMEMKKSA